MNQDSLGTRLGKLREQSGLSLTELGELARLKSPSHIGMIERGQRPHIEAATAVAICRVLGCSVEWLVLGEGDAPSPDSVRAAVERARAEQPTEAVA